MKNMALKILIGLTALIALSINAFANVDRDIKTFYQPQFEIIKVQPICPVPEDGGITCMAIGSKMTIKTTLNGCLDRLRFFDVQKVNSLGLTSVYITSVAHDDPRNATVRCIKANTVEKTIILPNHISGEVDLINMIIE